MNSDSTLHALAEYYGILPSFRDLSGTDRSTSRETLLALLSANDVDITSKSARTEHLENLRHERAKQVCNDEYIVEANHSSTIRISAKAEWHLSIDGGHPNLDKLSGRSSTKIALPPLPSGIHTLTLNTESGIQSVTIIAAPTRAPSVTDRAGRPKIWGLNAALFGLHSEHSGELGNYEDLALASEAMASLGASFLGINPVHSIGWAEEDIISPYSPSHRGFLNTDHIYLGAADDTANGIAAKTSHINYNAHRSVHKAQLESAFSNFQSNASNEARESYFAFKTGEGSSLHKFALFEVLSEIHGPDWREWPDQFQNVENQAVSKFADDRDARIEFHSWLQWVANNQLARSQSRAKSAGMPIGLYLDLAVGARRGGAETWCESPVVAKGVSIGAPPDHLSPAGQNWNLAAFAPMLLKKSKYSAFRSILRHALRYAGILRIDHVLGLNRSFWIPDGGAPGGYIRQPFEALLAIVAIEAEKSGTIIVGEDLGLVPEGFRARLRERGLYSYSVLQYEKNDSGRFRDPNKLQKQSITCFSTHDTPTLHGYMKQRDIDWWRRLGWIDATTESELRINRKNEVAQLFAMNVDEGRTATQDSFDRLSSTIHAALANSPAAMISVQLDDALGAIEAQNLPGTVNEHVNWQRRTSIPVESFSTNPELIGIAKQMHTAGRSTSYQGEK